MPLLESESLVRLLEAASENHRVIANNLANLDTPGYKSRRMRFAEELAGVLDDRGNVRPSFRIETQLYRPLFRDAGPDGNDVLLEREIVEMNKNALKTRLYLSVLGFRIRRLRMAIQGT